jgi:hypothetical protein
MCTSHLHQLQLVSWNGGPSRYIVELVSDSWRIMHQLEVKYYVLPVISSTLLRMMYKIWGGGPGVHFNVGLSDLERAELDYIILEELMATHKPQFSSGLSLYRWVSWQKNTEKWKASITYGGMQKSLGYFLLEGDVAHAYDKAEKEKNGRYVYLYH